MQLAARSSRRFAAGDRVEGRSLRSAILAALFACAALAWVGCSSGPGPGSALPQLDRPRDDGGLVDATVLRVIDGITIDVKDESGSHRVRYLGIEVRPDGPSGRSRLSVQAEALNRYLVEGRTVQLERDVLDVDASGELLRYVYVDGEMVNMALLANGFATVADSPAVFAYRASFLAMAETAQASAQSAIVGPGAQSGPAASQAPGGRRAFGTLPVPQDARRLALRCDFSETGQPLIKAIVDARTAERVYHVPGGLSYSGAVVDAANGDGWFCTEGQAVADGWKRSPQ